MPDSEHASGPGFSLFTSMIGFLATAHDLFALTVRLLVWLVLLIVIFVPLEKLFSERPSNFFRPQLWNDLFYYFLTSLVSAVIIALPMAFLAASTRTILPEAYFAWVRSLPMWITLPAALIIGDVGSYWGHRLTHEIPLLWRFHAVHHSPEQMDFLVNGRAHPVDIVWVRLWALGPVYLLGLEMGQHGGIVPMVVVLFGTLTSFFVHANLRWRLGPLEWLIATPAFHHWHHTRRKHINKNYSATFPWVDRIFRTHYLPDHFPEEYGITGEMPESLSGQLLAPFLPRKKKKVVVRRTKAEE